MSWFRTAALIFSFFISAAAADPQLMDVDTSSKKLIEYLNQEKVDLIHLISETSTASEQINRAQFAQKIKQNDALFVLIHAKISSLEGFLINQRQQQKLITLRIKKTTQRPNQKLSDPIVQEELARLATIRSENNQAIDLIVENLALSHRYEMGLLMVKHHLDEWKVKQEGVEHFEKLQQQIALLQHERQGLYEKNVQLQQEKTINSSFNQTYDDEINLQLNNENITLINAQMSFFELQIKLIKADDLLLKQQDIKIILSLIDTYKESIDQLDQIKQQLTMMVNLLKEEASYLINKETKQRVIILENKAAKLFKQVTEHQSKLVEALDLKQRALKQQLSVRQTLAGYQVNSWMAFKNEVSQTPSQLYAYLTGFKSKSLGSYARMSSVKKMFMWLNLIIIFSVALVLNNQLKAVTQDKERSRLSAHLYDGLLVLLARNCLQLAFFFMMLVFFTFIQLPSSNYGVFVNLFIVWFVFRNLIIIARMVLLERDRDIYGKDTHFFYRLKWLLIAGGAATLCMVLSQQLPLSLLIQAVFTRLFMLFILAAAFVMWASKDVFPLLLRPILKAKKRYLKNAVSLLLVLMPITLFTTAIIGLIGYMNLAWSMSRYQAYLVSVMILYVLARGLISDALELISEWLLSSTRSGWLWIEVFLKPLDKIIHLVLFFASVIFLFQLFGVYTEMPVLQWLKRFGTERLIDVSGVHISLLSILEFCIVLSVFIWAAKWTREFCYRWVYRHSQDDGVRNSLSVFTQYGVILLGGYITLRVLGLDFTGMSVVIGGLAVGMGFGLRDFASNIVGGIMLLIERPVREGDLITLGEHEGRVAHIGIRSMRVSSWDNTEVLIPNAETFNKPFTNWTHQDSVVRTVVPLKVSREDDPILIQQLIFEVLQIIPEIMQEPPSQVLLKQIHEALIEFEVRYFINIQMHTRFEIRSKFLFALTAQFKAAGVKPPIPPLSVEIKNVGTNYVLQTKTTED
jgi:potassium efflux system protein